MKIVSDVIIGKYGTREEHGVRLSDGSIITILMPIGKSPTISDILTDLLFKTKITSYCWIRPVTVDIAK